MDTKYRRSATHLTNKEKEALILQLKMGVPQYELAIRYNLTTYSLVDFFRSVFRNPEEQKKYGLTGESNATYHTTDNSFIPRTVDMEEHEYGGANYSILSKLPKITTL